MADFNNAIMTTGGAALLAATTAGTARLKFTKLVTGSGSYTDQEKTRGSLQARTSLKAQKQEFPFSSITMASETCVKLVALVSNATLDAGYYVNEVGIYAVDELDADAEPVLYSIAIANVADYLPPYNGLTPSTITQEYFATVDNALEVTIQTKTGAVALAEDLEALEAELEEIAQQNEKRFVAVDDTLELIMQDNDRIYPGRDLTSIFALEIAQYSDAWAWIKARIKAHNFTGIHVADYIPITMNGQTVKITETGRIIMKPCRESITRERRRLKKQAKLVEAGVLTFDAVRCSYASYIGSLQHRDAYRTIQSMNRLFNRLFIEQWKGDQEHEQNEQQGNEDQRTD